MEKFEIAKGVILEAIVKGWPEMNSFARDWHTEYLGNVMDCNSECKQVYAHFKDACDRDYLVAI